jgi:hypothetical protein
MGEAYPQSKARTAEKQHQVGLLSLFAFSALMQGRHHSTPIPFGQNKPMGHLHNSRKRKNRLLDTMDQEEIIKNNKGDMNISVSRV